MVDLSKLESEQVELKFENEYRRLKKREYDRKAAAKKKELKRMLIDANQEQEYKRLKKNAYQREYYRKLAAKNKELKRMLSKAEDGELAASGA